MQLHNSSLTLRQLSPISGDGRYSGGNWSFGARSKISHLLRGHHPRKLILEIYSRRENREASLCRDFRGCVIVFIIWFIFEYPFSHSYGAWLRLHAALPTILWSVDFLLRFRLPHWMVITCFLCETPRKSMCVCVKFAFSSPRSSLVLGEIR